MPVIKINRVDIMCDGCGAKIVSGTLDPLFADRLADSAIYCRLCRDRGVSPSGAISVTGNPYMEKGDTIRIDHGAPDDNSQHNKVSQDASRKQDVVPMQQGDTLEVDDVKEEPAKPPARVVQGAGGVLATVRAQAAQISDQQAKDLAKNAS